jgi:hypothetical protein
MGASAKGNNSCLSKNNNGHPIIDTTSHCHLD